MLAFCLVISLSACATTEGGQILRGAIRHAKNPTAAQYELTFSAGQNGDYKTYLLSGTVEYATDKQLKHMTVNVLVDNVQTQEIEYYIEQDSQNQMQIYRRIGDVWTIQEMTRANARHFDTSLNYSLSLDFLRGMRRANLDGEQEQDGILCSRISGDIPPLQAEGLLPMTLLPDLFGIDTSDLTIFDSVEDVPSKAYIGVDDNMLYRLTLNLGPMILPMFSLTVTRNSIGSEQTRALWDGVSLAYCQLDVRYSGHGQEQSIVIPDLVRLAAMGGSAVPQESEDTSAQTSEAPEATEPALSEIPIIQPEEEPETTQAGEGEGQTAAQTSSEPIASSITVETIVPDTPSAAAE